MEAWVQELQFVIVVDYAGLCVVPHVIDAVDIEVIYQYLFIGFDDTGTDVLVGFGTLADGLTVQFILMDSTERFL